MVAQKTYEEGVRDGEIKALKSIQGRHEIRLDSHSKRLRVAERMLWLLLGGLAVLQLLPAFFQLVNSFRAGS